MKNLTTERIKDLQEKLPEDLGSVTRAFEKFSKLMKKEMSAVTSQNPLFAIQSVEKAVLRPAVSKEGSFPGISKLFMDTGSGIAIQITIDRDLVDILCELAFGGDGSEVHLNEGRPLSNIEKDIAIVFMKMFARNLAHCVSSEVPSEFVLEAPSDQIKRPDKQTPKFQLSVKMQCDFKLMTGGVCFDLPADVMLRFENEDSAEIELHEADRQKWGEHMITRLEPADIDLIATLTELSMPLNAISTLHIGQTVPLGVTFSDPVIVEVGDINLHEAQLGQSNGHYCLVIKEQQISAQS
jgi:flagellar motor switch protein FliM